MAGQSNKDCDPTIIMQFTTQELVHEQYSIHKSGGMEQVRYLQATIIDACNVSHHATQRALAMIDMRLTHEATQQHALSEQDKKTTQIKHELFRGNLVFIESLTKAHKVKLKNTRLRQTQR